VSAKPSKSNALAGKQSKKNAAVGKQSKDKALETKQSSEVIPPVGDTPTQECVELTGPRLYIV